MTKRKQNLWILGGLVIMILGVAAAFVWPKITLWQAKKTESTLQESVPVATAANPSPTLTVSTEPTESTPIVTDKPLPDQLNLAVPFTSQAPTGNWDTEHEELCEEASSLMVDRYFIGQKITDSADAEAGMQKLVDWENTNLGTMESTTAAQTASMIRSVYGLTINLKSNPTIEDIKQALTNGNLIILPAAGRKLGNPYFTAPGPLYHMLVIKGYIKNGDIITNDPGTKHGADYVYSSKTLLAANGDWNDGDPANGDKVLLEVSKH